MPCTAAQGDLLYREKRDNRGQEGVQLATGRLEFRGAVVLRDDDVDRIVARLQALPGTPRFTGRVYWGPSRHHYLEDPRLIATVENPRSDPIRSLVFESTQVTYAVSAGPVSLEVSWKDASPELQAAVRQFFASERKNLRAFHSFVYEFMAWLYSGWRLWATAAASLIIVSFAVWRVVAAFLAPCPTDILQLPGSSPLRPHRFTMMLQAFFWLLVWIGLWIGWLWLFPRAVFALREGKHRYDWLVRFRFFVVGSVFIPLLWRLF
jgi:hypothetical protein